MIAECGRRLDCLLISGVVFAGKHLEIKTNGVIIVRVLDRFGFLGDTKNRSGGVLDSTEGTRQRLHAEDGSDLVNTDPKN